MIDANQFKDLVLRPTLQLMPSPFYSGPHNTNNCNSPEAQQLVFRTMVHESGGFEYIRQETPSGYGPGYGPISMQENRWYSDWEQLEHKKDNDENWEKLWETIRQNIMVSGYEEITELHWNLALNVAMCRLAYLLKPVELPPAGDLKAQANYWFDYYNQSPERLSEERTDSFKKSVKYYIID